MGVVRELTEVLPKGYTALDDDGSTILRCDWCGTEKVISTVRPSMGVVMAAVEKHSAECIFRTYGTR